MKKLTIEWKIILCFTAIFILIVAAAIPLNYFMIAKNLAYTAETQLQYEVTEISNNLEFKDDAVIINEELVDPGTYVAVYSEDNVLLAGEMHPDFPLNVSAEPGEMYSVNSVSSTWIIYDYEIVKNGENFAWIRATKPLYPISDTIKRFKSMIYKIIPIYIVLAFFGLLFIRRILSPVNDITKTAIQISQGDLTKRINFDGSHDEVGLLAESFDEMLDCLEDLFNREKRFSSDVSHELRTPITAIILSAEEALDGEKTAQEYQENLKAILNEGRKMSSLISQLLLIARSSDGKYTPEMELTDISSLTSAVIDELSERAENSEIIISAEIEKGIVMLVEQTLYMRLLINLIDNAIKYNHPGGWVKVSLTRHTGFVSLCVEDNGIGIAKENLSKVWDRFFKADKSSINSSPGLGLSIVKWIAELHGGTVHVKSELNKGSLFEIRFVQKHRARDT